MDLFIGGGLLLGMVSGLHRDLAYTFIGTLILTIVTLGVHYVAAVSHIPWWEYTRHWLCCVVLSEPMGYVAVKWKREITMWVIMCTSAVCTWTTWCTCTTRSSSRPAEDPKPVAIAVQHPDGYICLGV
jgi:hypothetical protein